MPAFGRAVELASWRSVAAGPLVALATLVAALVATAAAGVPFRDPDHVAAKYLVAVGGSVVLLVLLDIVVRAGRRAGTLRPPRAVLLAVRRERWSGYRALAAGSALASFYLSYLAYRNLKSVLPLLRPQELFDSQLAAVDRALFLGNDPAALLHAVIGTGPQAHIFSTVYVGFIVLLPLSLAVALVHTGSLRRGLFYTTAVSLNWPLGAASYYLLPALGPIYATPGAFTQLTPTETSRLQGVLLDDRLEFLRDPSVAGTAQHIAAFASVHTSMIFTAVVAAHLLGLGRRVRIALWTLLAFTTTATVYFGWHYVVDDLAGMVLALLALALAVVLTGIDPRTMRRRGGETAEAA